MNARFSQSVSKIPVVPSYLEPCVSCEMVRVDSKVNERFIRLVIWSVLISGNIFSYSAPDEMSLLSVIRLSGVMIAVVLSMALITSKIRL